MNDYIVCMKMQGFDPAFYGPFDGPQTARDWIAVAKTYVHHPANWQVIPLNPPKQFEAERHDEEREFLETATICNECGHLHNEDYCPVCEEMS